MATTTRPSTIGRGSASGGTGPVDIRHAPTVQNTVIGRQGVQFAQPFKGASQVGASFAARLESMGAGVNQFFQSLSGSALKAADIAHTQKMYEIEQDNIVQRRQAVKDETEDPGGDYSGHELEDDRDYYETRQKIRAGVQARAAGASWVEQELPNLGLGVNHAEAFATFAATQMEGMDPMYAGHYAVAMQDAVMPHIDTHITNLYKAEETKARDEFAAHLMANAGATPTYSGLFGDVPSMRKHANNFIHYSNVDRIIKDADTVLPAHWSQGAKRSWLINTVLDGYKNTPNAERGIAAFMNQLATNPSLGDGEKTFQQLFPTEFAALATDAKKITNDAYNIQGDAAATQLKNYTLEMKNPGNSPQDLHALINSAMSYVADPHVQQYLHNHDGARAAAQSLYTQINSIVSSGAAEDAVLQYMSNQGPLPPERDLKQVAGKWAQTIGQGEDSANFDAAAQLLAKAPSNAITPITTQVAAVFTNPDLPNTAPDSQARSVAENMYKFIHHSSINYDLSDGKLKKKLGDHAYHVYDVARGQVALGMSPVDAILSANAMLNSTEFAEHLETTTLADTEQIFYRNAAGRRDDSTAKKLSKLLEKNRWFGEDPGFGEDVVVDRRIVNAFMTDLRRNLYGKDVNNKDELQAAFEKTSRNFADEYQMIQAGHGNDKKLIHKSNFSGEQTAMLREVTVGGKTRIGIEEFGTNLDRMFTGSAYSITQIPNKERREFAANITEGGGQRTDIGPELSAIVDRPDNMRFLENILGDRQGLSFENLTNPESRANGSFPIVKEDGNWVAVGLNPDTPATLSDGRMVPSMSMEFRDRNGNIKTITVIPDEWLTTGGEKQEINIDAPHKVLSEGGQITMSGFKNIFNESASEYGFEFVERYIAGQQALTLEYSGTIPTEQEIKALDALRIQELSSAIETQGQADLIAGGKMRKVPLLGWEIQGGWFTPGVLDEDPGPRLSVRERTQMSLYGIRWRGMHIRDARNALQSAIKDRGLNPSKPDGSVMMMNSQTKNMISQLNKVNTSENETSRFTEHSDRIVAQLQTTGQVRPSVDLTVTGLIPDKITSAEQLADLVQTLVREEGMTTKGGLPNERDDQSIESSYVKVRKDLIYAGEGVREKAYMDTSGVPTIGVGFNLQDPTVKRVVTKMVGEDQYKQMLADARQTDEGNKIASLTEPQMELVFESIIAEKEAHVTSWYKDTYLTPTQRAVIVDLAYQGGSAFVGPNTNFHKAVNSGNWNAAISEVRHRSNRYDVAGIQTRMNTRADVLETTVTEAERPILASTWSTTRDVVGSVLDAINPVSSAVAGEAEAAIHPESPIPETREEHNRAFKWMTDTWAKASQPSVWKSVIANTIGSVAVRAAPTSSSGMLVSDIVFKNMMGVPLENREYTGKDLEPDVRDVLRELAVASLAKGNTSIEWSDYGVDINGAPISGIVGGEGVAEADRVYPNGYWGKAKLGMATMIDPKLDLALTLGGASITIDERNHIIVTDSYNGQKFLYGSSSQGAYGSVRDFIGQGDMLTMELPGNVDAPRTIKWRIDLGPSTMPPPITEELFIE